MKSDPECNKKKSNLSHTGLFGIELDFLYKYSLLDDITFIHSFINSKYILSAYYGPSRPQDTTMTKPDKVPAEEQSG